MLPAQKKRYDKCGPIVAEALKKRHFEAYYCSTPEEAAQLALSLIPVYDTVAWGGSMTIDSLEIQKKLKARGTPLIDRDTAKTPEERVNIMRQALLCDTFLCSSNAITEDGQLVNMDGNGNRVAAMIYGPKSVIVIAGMNKVVKTWQDAIARTRNLAAPTNAQRFGIKTPCKENGQCADCLCPDSICADFVTIRLCRPVGRIKVILVGEDLGM